MIRKALCPLMLVLVLAFSSAHAASLNDDSYTDVPTAMTQDSVLELSANENCTVSTLLPDVTSIALLDNVYRHGFERFKSKEHKVRISTSYTYMEFR